MFTRSSRGTSRVTHPPSVPPALDAYAAWHPKFRLFLLFFPDGLRPHTPVHPTTSLLFTQMVDCTSWFGHWTHGCRQTRKSSLVYLSSVFCQTAYSYMHVPPKKHACGEVPFILRFDYQTKAYIRHFMYVAYTTSLIYINITQILSSRLSVLYGGSFER